MQDIAHYDLKKLRLDKEPRPVQKELFEFTRDSILANKKFIMIDAPTGTGKSVYGVMVMDWFQKNYSATATFDILTNSKILQEQYTTEFDFMNSLWGKASYHCEKFNCDCGTGSEWARLQNVKCEGCPYAEAKYKFENGDVALTNFHLFMTYKIYMPMAWKRTSSVLIIDEAHEFESVFCDFVTTKISRPLLRKNGFTDEEVIKALNVFGSYPEDLDIRDFVRIVNEDFLPVVKTVLNRLHREAEAGSMLAMKSGQSLMNNFLKWEILATEYNKMPDNWILECEHLKKYGKDKKMQEDYIEFVCQPVFAYPYLEDKIWKRYDFVIFMSGTILDKSLFCKMNGLDHESAAYLAVDTPFPVENRPIYFFKNIGKYTYKTKEQVWPKQKIVLEKILKKHKNDKGLIYTVNYELQGLVKQLDSDRFLAHDSTNRSETLQHHYNSIEPTILVSPSMNIGVDLFEDYSRHQTILKMPYPNLKSKKIKKRMDIMPDTYGLSTVRDFIQFYGRSIRSNDDKAKTYVLDSCFNDVLKWSGRWIPKWVKDAIHYVD